LYSLRPCIVVRENEAQIYDYHFNRQGVDKKHKFPQSLGVMTMKRS